MAQKNNIYSIGLDLLKGKLLNKRIPLQIQLSVNNQCNQQCTYCQKTYVHKEFNAPSTAMLIELINGLSKLGTKRITLIGGEPLLRDDIGEIITHIKKLEISAALITNGRLIDRSKEWLKKLDQLSVSIDDSKTAHDAYRGKSSWDSAIKAVQVARGMGIPVQLLCTITKLTEIELSNLYKIAEEYNCTVNFDCLYPTFNNNFSSYNRVEDAGEEKTKLILKSQLKNNNPRLILTSSSLKNTLNWPADYSTFRLFSNNIPKKNSFFKCQGGKFFGYIDCNGNLFPCCIPFPDYKPINVYTKGMQYAWNNMPQINCLTCRSVGYVMFNALFSLDLKTILEFSHKEMLKSFRMIL